MEENSFHEIDFTNGTYNYKQIVCAVDLSTITDTSYFWFEIDNRSSGNYGNGLCYLVNAFAYIVDDATPYLTSTTQIPVVKPNPAVELEKCKYYYEKPTKAVSWVNKNGGYISFNTYISYKPKRLTNPTLSGTITMRYYDTTYDTYSDWTISASSVTLYTDIIIGSINTSLTDITKVLPGSLRNNTPFNTFYVDAEIYY